MGEYLHSKQVQFNRSYASCGVVEAHHLPDESPNATLFAIANSLYHKANGRPAAFVMFSDTVDSKDSRGQHLADYIQTKAIGLWESEKAINPRTGHTIRVWMWQVDHEVFRKWYADEYVNRIDE